MLRFGIVVEIDTIPFIFFYSFYPFSIIPYKRQEYWIDIHFTENFIFKLQSEHKNQSHFPLKIILCEYLINNPILLWILFFSGWEKKLFTITRFLIHGRKMWISNFSNKNKWDMHLNIIYICIFSCRELDEKTKLCQLFWKQSFLGKN